MINAIIFDYDGVIVNGDLARFTFFQHAFAARNIYLDYSLFPGTVGKTSKEIFAKVIDNSIDEKNKKEVLDEYANIYKRDYINYLMPIETTVRYIKEYNGDKQFIISSNTDRQLIVSALETLGILDHFSYIISKDMVKRPKPYPDVYETAMSKTNFEKNEVVVIEDSVVGVQAAISAGLESYVFLNTLNSREEFANMPIKGFISTEEDFYKITYLS